LKQGWAFQLLGPVVGGDSKKFTGPQLQPTISVNQQIVDNNSSSIPSMYDRKNNAEAISLKGLGYGCISTVQNRPRTRMNLFFQFLGNKTLRSSPTIMPFIRTRCEIPWDLVEHVFHQDKARVIDG
jgi:hypothetical protein